MSIARLPARAFPRLIALSCVLGLAAIALMVWSVADPRPLQVILAMSIGQVLGTLSLAIFAFVVIADLRRTRLALAQKPEVTSE